MDLDNFIIGKTKEKEERGDLAKKQQLLSKHRVAADGKNSQKIVDCCHMVGRPLQIHQTTAA